MHATFSTFLAASCVIATCTPAWGTDTREVLAGRGMWVQHPGKTTDSQLDALHKLGVRRLHVMVSHATVPYASCDKAAALQLTATRPALEALVKAAKAKGFAVVATAYMPPSREHIESALAADGPVPALVAAGADAVEYDLEGGWSRSKVCGYDTHADAARSLYERTRAMRDGLPVGVTTHLSRARDPHIALANADWLSLQAYAKCQAGNCVAFDDKREGPGSREARVPRELGGDFGKPVVVGLAAFNQKWPGRSVDEAMRKSLAAVEALGKADPNYVGHSYWSATWALRDAEVSGFLGATAAP